MVIGDELSKVFNYQRIYKNLDHGLGSFSVDIYAWEGEGHTDWGRDEGGTPARGSSKLFVTLIVAFLDSRKPSSRHEEGVHTQGGPFRSRKLAQSPKGAERPRLLARRA